MEPAVARSGSDDHRAGARSLARMKVQGEGTIGAVLREACHLIGDRHLSPEFLRLIVGARHQRNTADSRRKAEIVFDPSRCSCLTAKGTGI